MLSILASFAQEESRSLSDNCKWGIRKRMEQGIPNGHFRVYGYRWEGDELVPVPEEAAIVKRIFQNFLDGKSRLETEREFAAEGITTREGCRWVDSNIKSVLTNVTYTGNLLLQKEFVADPLTKKRKKNHGELPQYYVPDTHEAIIGKETFDWVQSEIARRKELGPLANKALNTCFLTGRIKCGCCGLSYMHSQRQNRAKRTLMPEVVETWSCGTRKKKGGHCAGREIPHRIILQEICTALGLDEIDEQVFSEQIDHITVTGAKELTFHFLDGHETVQHWVNTSKKDCWTQEARDAASAYRRSHQALGKKGASCFTSKIKCGCCGNNFQKQTRHDRDYDVGIWTCATRKSDAAACRMSTIREDVLKERVCDALEIESFTAETFQEKVDHITITGNGTMSIFLKDGTSRDTDFSTKRKMPPASEETRQKRSAAISNPPFGIDWKREQKAVEAEAAKGEAGRFAPGLPKISDGQQLFVLNGLRKLNSKGRMAIIQNGSPLFSGDAGSGPSEIRRYILENDWLSAIIQLSTDMFMNTGISTYIWVLDKDKPAERAGKVQLIDASHCFTPRRKSIGTKRNDISDRDRQLIVEAFSTFTEGVFGDKAGVYCESRIFTTDEFGYNKIVVERPLRDEQGQPVLKRGKPVPDADLRDTENVPLTEDIDAYFAREVAPYAPDAWIDRSKTKIGYEIPMTRYFYEYQKPEPSADILTRIIGLEDEIAASLKNLFGEG